MTPQQIHAVATPDGIRFYATRFLPVTNHNGARLKFWRVNLSLEKIEPAKTVSWSYEHTGQQAQLQNALGQALMSFLNMKQFRPSKRD